METPGTVSPPEELADAAEALAAALDGDPEVAEARAGLTAEDERFFLEFALPRAALLPATGDVAQIAAKLTPAAVAERVERLRETADSPLGLAAAPWLAADPLGFGQVLLAHLGAGAGAVVDPLTGAFLARDGRAALVVVRPSRADLDPAAGRALQQALDRAAVRASETSGLPLSVSAVGGPLYAAHDEEALRRDLLRTVALATLLVGLLVVLAFDGVAIPLAALLAMVAAQVWAAGVVSLGVGRVTAVSVGLAAILVGLGDDYVVHVAARFRDGIAAGRTQAAAMAEAVRETGPGILSAALTTAAGFAVLAFARFRPVAELGLFVALGVLVVLVTTVTVAAPALAVGARRWRPGASRPAWRAFGGALEHLVGLAGRRRRWVLTAALVATALAVLGTLRLRLDADLRRLRPVDAAHHALEVRLAEQFGLGLDTATVVVSAPTMDDALRRADSVARALRTELPPGAGVVTPSDLLPPRAAVQARLHALQSLPWLRVARDLRDRLDAAGLAPQAFARALSGLESLGQGRDPVTRQGGLEMLPSWTREALRVGPGDVAVAVQVRLPLHAWPEGPPEEIRASVARVAPGARWASAPWLGAEVRAVALSDLKRLGTLAALVVAAGILVSFRGRPAPSLLAAVPVVLGSLWTFGLWGALGLPLDLFALGVVPVLLSMGVDDGLHVLHHAAGGEGLAEAVRRAGRGILLTNLTTSVGFGSLVLSQVPGLRNGGLLICVGNLLCMLATFVVLPAMRAGRAGPPPRWGRPTAR